MPQLIKHIYTSLQYGHSSVVAPNGDVLAEADENPTIVYAEIGEQAGQGIFS